MKKHIVGWCLGITICVGAVALGQTDSSPWQRMPATMLPDDQNGNPSSFLESERIALSQINRLDDAAVTAMNMGRYAEAEADARSSVSLGVASGRGRNILAATLDAQGKTQEALQAYNAIYNAGDVNPANELPYALLLLRLGQWVHAVQVYNRQLPYSGSDEELVQSYSDFTPNTPRPADLETAIHIGLGLELGWYEYHGTYQERIQQAQDHFQKALALEPDSPLANYYYGYGLRRMGRRADAQEAFKKAAALDVDNGDVKAAAEKALAGR